MDSVSNVGFHCTISLLLFVSNDSNYFLLSVNLNGRSAIYYFSLTSKEIEKVDQNSDIPLRNVIDHEKRILLVDHFRSHIETFQRCWQISSVLLGISIWLCYWALLLRLHEWSGAKRACLVQVWTWIIGEFSMENGVQRETQSEYVQ